MKPHLKAVVPNGVSASARWRQSIHAGGMRGAAVFTVLLCTALFPALLHAQRGFEGSLQIMSNRGAFLGVRLQDVSSDQARSMKLPGEYGAIVTEVEPDSPAAKAGLQVNDVILEFGGMKVWSASQLQDLVRETPSGRSVALVVSRGGEQRTLEASLTHRGPYVFHTPPMPPMPVRPRNFSFDFVFGGGRLGVHVETLGSQLAAYFGVKQGKGALVTEVEKDSPAAKAGLEAGDCIIKAGDTEIDSASDLVRAVDRAQDSKIALSVVRHGREETITSGLNAPPQPFNSREIYRDAQRQIQDIQRETQRQIQEIQRQIPRLEEQARRLEREAQRSETQWQVRMIQREVPRLQEEARRLQREAQRLGAGQA